MSVCLSVRLSISVLYRRLSVYLFCPTQFYSRRSICLFSRPSVCLCVFLIPFFYHSLVIISPSTTNNNAVFLSLSRIIFILPFLKHIQRLCNCYLSIVSPLRRCKNRHLFLTRDTQANLYQRQFQKSNNNPYFRTLIYPKSSHNN